MKGAMLSALAALGSLARYPQPDRRASRAFRADTTPAERRKRREARRNRKRNAWRNR